MLNSGNAELDELFREVTVDGDMHHGSITYQDDELQVRVDTSRRLLIVDSINGDTSDNVTLAINDNTMTTSLRPD